MNEKIDDIEVRLHNDGTVDEIILYDGKICRFHLEQMDDNLFWARFYGTTQDLVVHICATTGQVDSEEPIDGEPITDKKGTIIGYKNFTEFKKVEGPKITISHEWEDSHTQSDSPPQYQTPELERHKEIAEVVNKYGISLLLQEISNIYKEGRKEPFELELVKELEQIKDKFVTDKKAHWNKIMDKYLS